jgi:superfamily II DNA or RNA helicase
LVRIIIDNYVRISGLPRDVFEEVRKRLTYDNPVYEQALKFRKRGMLRQIPKTIRSYEYDQVEKEILLPRGVFMEFMDYIGRLGLPFDIIDRRQKQKVEVPNAIVKLRSYQEKMIQDGSLYPGPGYILQAPPGTGKTLVGLELARREGRKTLWIAHKKFLVKQVIDAAIDTKEVPVLCLPRKEVGIVGAGTGKVTIGKFLTVAAIQTISRRTEELAQYKYEFGTIIIDEVHHAPASTWKAGAHLFSPKLTVGLTATSYRTDGLTDMLFDCVGPVTAVADKDLLKAEGVIIVPTYCVLYTNLRYSGTSFADIESKLIADPRRNNILRNVTQEILEQNDVNVVLLLSRRVAHVDLLTEVFYNLGYNPVKLTGPQSNLERNIAMERIVSNERPRLLTATYDLLSEGFNYKPISHIIYGTPFRNEIRVEQSVGRAQRVEPLKQDAWIIDLADENRMLHRQANIRRYYAQGLGMPIVVYNQNIFRSQQ